ncbi:unnamed protein product [Ranitomeya imitator]|uniref:Uncharacterized protein n=1 Tax=Ranitomeya imitator TaxID=111125 RepID=A0ABN9MN05_9NEOB|nr:unnamed protein product [Ranitomeya imitator]
MGEAQGLRSTRRKHNNKKISTEAKEDEKNVVINLSSYVISETQMDILSKGLTFSPTNEFDMYRTLLDVNKFVRNLTLKCHFFKEKSDQDAIQNLTTQSDQTTLGEIGTFQELCSISDLRTLESESIESTKNLNSGYKSKKPYFYPVNSRPNILDSFQECIEEDLIELKKKSSCNHNRPNLSKLERKALEEIRGNQDLMVRRADKGGAVVLLNAGLYVQQNMVMLNNSNTYRRLQHDPTELFQKKLKHLLSEGFAIGALDKKLSEDLFVEHPIIPIFHSLPKIHKEVFPPTFRPIVAGIGSMG